MDRGNGYQKRSKGRLLYFYCKEVGVELKRTDGFGNDSFRHVSCRNKSVYLPLQISNF